ncbi:CASP8-associated protein 2 [Rhinophrynus dorsalis]
MSCVSSPAFRCLPGRTHCCPQARASFSKLLGARPDLEESSSLSLRRGHLLTLATAIWTMELLFQACIHLARYAQSEISKLDLRVWCEYSPAKSDASSVDIYDGLDMSILAEEPSELSTPTRDCLDLYEEILTEEGTAKETSFNDLNAEYERCQKQMRELISRLKEMQTQNTSLQNENQCLKKNISALIKTARVEINRKEEEINRLNQSLMAPVKNRSIKSIPASLVSTSKTSCRAETRPKAPSSRNTESSWKPESKPQELSYKDSPKTATEKERCSDIGEDSTPCSLKTSDVKLYKESMELSYQKQALESHSDLDEKGRKEKDLEQRHKDTDRRYRRDDRRHGTVSYSNDKKNVELKDKCHGKSDSYQESKNAKSDVNYEKNGRKYSTSSSWDKSGTMKEKVHLRDEHRSKEKFVKTNEKSPNRRESKGYEKDKNTEYKNRVYDKDLQPRRSKRTNTSHLKEEDSHKSARCERSDDRRSSDAGRREKHSAEHNKDSKPEYKKDSKAITVGKRDFKTVSYKNDDKRIRDSKNVKSDKDKRGEENKRTRERDGTISEQREHKENAEEEALKYQSSCKIKNKLKDDFFRIGEQSAESNVSIESKKEVLGMKEADIPKNSKLSFMETLNLTVSPAKKPSLCYLESNTAHSTISDVECDTSEIREVQDASCQVTQLVASMEEMTFTSHQLKSPKQTDVKEAVLVSVKTTLTNVETLEEPSFIMSQPEPIKDTKQPPTTAVAESSSTKTAADNRDEDLNDDLHSVSSEGMETQSFPDGSEIIHLDSFIEIDRCSGSESPPASDNENVVQTGSCQDGTCFPKQVQDDVDNHASSLKPILTEPTKGICEPSNSVLVELSTKEVEYKQCFHDDDDGGNDDDGSVMNIDLHFLRLIPKIISPLKSPVRPLVKLHTNECTDKASVVSVLNPELCYVSSDGTRASLSKELDKENCQPDDKIVKGSGKNTQLQVSLDEVEEGEILSDVDNGDHKSVGAPKTTKSPQPKDPVEQIKESQSPTTRRGKVASTIKPNGIIPPKKMSASKLKEKRITDKKTKLLKLPKAQKPTTDSCLEGILNIVLPCNVQDVLQMLRLIRKHIRKKYMKFKMQFSIRQFQKVIEMGALCFVTLVKSLDWSTLCSSSGSLQKKLCKLIESRLKKMKRNGIVDRIFELHLIDMKKKLWKFVDDQFDSLFDTLKAILTKCCDKAELECDGNESKVKSTLTPNINSAPAGNSLQKLGLQSKRVQTCINESRETCEPCLGQGPSEIQCKTKISSVKKHKVNAGSDNLCKKLSISSESVKECICIGCDSKSVMLSGRTRNSKSRDPSAISEPLAVSSSEGEKSQKSQQSTSGLSFNLVSDDHMGDVFKSLLHDSDTPKQSNTVEENLWILKTPEKTNSSKQKCENLTSSLENDTPIKMPLSPPPLSPLQLCSFSTLEDIVLINPDVLDESCMLETPISASSSKSLPGVEEKTKSFSSVLMEDLAVSLTVPSPLKSDSHLSFLRQVSASDYISEEIINKHHSDISVLEEEYVAEQDIHLTLDSDNSSSCSLENKIEPSSFQYHPSEPMQAVIMEKSNDHFIVKIRRAVSSTSPSSDCSSTEYIASVVPQVADVEVKDICTHVLEPEMERNSQINGNYSIYQTEQHTESDLTHVIKDELDYSINDKGEGANSSKTCSTHEPMVLPVKSPEPIGHDLNSTIDAPSQTNGDQYSEGGKPGYEKNILIEKNHADNLGGLEESSLSIAVVDFGHESLNNKRKKTLQEVPLAKRHKVQHDFALETKSKSRKKDGKDIKTNTMGMEKYHKKHTRSASDTTLLSTSNMSAKNVVKKKGEVVVSWSRDEDRLILLECQKLGPNQKTFLSLSSEMNKYPYQIEERFRQLMKLFKKCRHSTS